MSKEYVELSQRIELLEKRIEELEKQYPPLTTIEARIGLLENAVASLKLCVPPPEVESVRCDGNQTAFVGHSTKDERDASIHEIADLKKRIFYVENAVAALKVYHLPTACRCKRFESGVA